MAVDQQLARTLLTDAAARYESAGRWSLIVCVSILVFHILTFSPFIQAQVERASLTGQSKLLTDASADVASALEAQETAIKEVRDDLDAMLESKKADFALLQRAVEAIRRVADTRTSPSAAPADRMEASPMVQMSQATAQAVGPRLEESARVEFFMEAIRQQGLVEQVRGATSGRKLRIALRPIVERDIIEPRFQKVRNRWRERLPELRSKAMAAKDRFVELEEWFPDERRWTEISEGIDSYVATLENVTFRPPDNPEWWHTVVGKDEAVVAMKSVAVDQISTPSFKKATTALEKLLGERKQLLAALDAKLEDLQRQFDEQNERLSDLIAPIKGVARELSVVVANFLLVLALLLAVTLIWPARRFMALIDAAKLAQRAGLVDEAGVEALWRPHNWTSEKGSHLFSCYLASSVPSPFSRFSSRRASRFLSISPSRENIRLTYSGLPICSCSPIHASGILGSVLTT